MKILHILGNGFDLNLGLKTRYEDFYEHYKTVLSKSDNIISLKNSIASDYNSWSDLELALGQYTEELQSLEDFDETFEHLGEELASYLKSVEDEFDVNRIDREKFFENLVMPEKFLSPADRKTISSHKELFINNQWRVDVVTFNYTTIVEKILGEEKNVKIGNHPKQHLNVTLRNIEHIHGYVDDRMVLGVNDISQLKNRSFHENQNILEAIVKEKCNKAYGHTLDDVFKNRIKQADLICMFGTSIGDTDNMWWEALGAKLKSKPTPLIIFGKGEDEIPSRIKYKIKRSERMIRKKFLEKAKLTKDEIERVERDIYVVLNSSMFKDILRNE